MEYQIEEHIVNSLAEPSQEYFSDELNSLTYKTIGAAMEVHNTLGRGFLEVVYKDCLGIELEKRGLAYQREKKFGISYKGIKIPHSYYADFLIGGKIIPEIKAQNFIIDENAKQIINYLAVSKCQIGLLINFGEDTLKYKRFVLTK